MADAVPAQLERAFGLIEAGKIDQAEAFCRESLSGNPDEVNLLGLLGAVLLKKGNYAEAEQCLLRTIELEPKFAKPYEDLGVLHMARDEPDKAAQYFEKAAVLGKGRESVMHMLTVANQFRQRGDHIRAQQICTKVLERNVNNVAALRLLAIIAADNEQFGTAENYLRQILELSPGQPGPLLDLGRFLGERSRFAEAITILEQAAALDNANPRIQLALGDMLYIVGRTKDALAAYERCLELEPNDTAALAGRGHMLRVAGRKDEAIESYRRAVDTKPDSGDGWWNLASIQGYSFNDGNVEEMQELAAIETMPADSKVPLRFALARALEQHGDYEGAWEQYSMANALARSLIKYDPVESEVTHRNIRNTFTAEMIGRYRAATPVDVTPCFIVGMPRSGSTLIEQILASHSMVQGLGELPYIVMLSQTIRDENDNRVGYPEAVTALDERGLTGLGRSYLHYAASHREGGEPYFTDKMPANFSHIGLIRMILPHARIIDARRHPLAACVANYRHRFAQGKNYTYDLAELAEQYLLYVEIMQHWDDVLPGAVLRVQYEDLVGDLESQVRRILEFCELPFEDACLAFHESDRPVTTASAEQVRQPIYDSAVAFWKHYESRLDELKDILAPVLDGRDSD